jgi:hypothetical protein
LGRWLYDSPGTRRLKKIEKKIGQSPLGTVGRANWAREGRSFKVWRRPLLARVGAGET